MSSPLITIENLSITRESTTILDGVDLTVEEGTLLGVVGPNGAGKTTLLRAIDGSISMTTGSVRVGDIAVESADATTISQQVASVPQNTSIAFNFDARTIVEMGRTPHQSRLGSWTATDDKAVEEAIEQVDAGEFVDQSVTTLSGGERQRILLARALAQQTPVLLLDEPTASLDIHRQIQTLESVARLVEMGKTAMAAIHDLNLAARYCDVVCLLTDGSVTAIGPPAEVFTTSALADTFGGYPVVTTDLITGAASVTTLPENHSDRSDTTGNDQSTETQHGEDETVTNRSEHRNQTVTQPVIHIIGHGQPVITAMSELVAAGYAVTIGPVPAESVTATTAHRIATSVITVPAYEGVTEAARTELQSMVNKAAVVIVTQIGLKKRMNSIAATVGRAENIIILSQHQHQHQHQHRHTTHIDSDPIETAIDKLPHCHDTVIKKTTDCTSVASMIETLLKPASEDQ